MKITRINHIHADTSALEKEIDETVYALRYPKLAKAQNNKKV